MLWWMALVADEREGAFSTLPWGASLVCLFFLAYGAFLAWDSYHRLPHAYAVLRARGVPATANLVRCARPESASIEAFAADFRWVSTDVFGPGTTQRTRLSSRVLPWARRFPSWSTRVIRASSTPSVTSNTVQTLEPLPCSGMGLSWSCSG
jgi:hypothetical protein